MLRWIGGDENFYAGVNSYLNDPLLRYKFARTPDLIKHMETAYNQELDWYFDDWFTGQGYPTYTFNIGQLPSKQATINIKQTQSHPSVSFFELPLPFRFYGQGKDTLIVFDNTQDDQLFEFSPGFLIDSLHFDPDMWIVCKVDTVTLGKYDLPANESLKIMPNPATDRLYVSHTLDKACSIQLVAIQGKKQQVEILLNTQNSIEIDVSKVPSGMYLLQLQFDKVKVTRKVLIN
jgi:aminopeptidase N